MGEIDPRALAVLMTVKRLSFFTGKGYFTWPRHDEL